MISKILQTKYFVTNAFKSPALLFNIYTTNVYSAKMFDVTLRAQYLELWLAKVNILSDPGGWVTRAPRQTWGVSPPSPWSDLV